MNRRNFLKRLAAVAAGAVAVPTIMKQLPFRSNPVQKDIARMCNTVTVSQESGVTLEQCMELAKMTLDDMPQLAFENI